ncbi:hypothetical protein FRC03_010982 [Tulasnella sp. 419]|nr:hypothetical protein FRC03_010982 [Tulasnella sp. 419]
MASVLTGETKLLYVTPERLESPRFIRLMKQTKISLLAIDESHCITEWGRSFRAAYSRIPRFAKKCNVERFLCLTATPTRQSIEEICQSFSIDKGGILRAPLHRPNLDYNIVVVGSSDDEPGRNVWILNKYRENPGQTLIYTRLRGQAMVLAHFLCSNGIQAKAYHAGLTKREREKIQDWFMKSPNAVICSTVAFGMGIDHPTVRHVFHHDPPSTLQGYAQETGRAGRDGRGANCTMLISAWDRSHAVNFPRGDTPSQKSIQSILARLVGTASSKFRTNIDKRRWQFRFNIRGGALSHLINQLSDKYGLIRIEDPVYDTAVFKLSEYLDTTFPSIKLDTSHASRIIQRRMEDQKSEEESVYHIDIPTLASENKFSRYLLTDTLHTWSDNGWIVLRKNPRSDSFKLLKPPLEDTDIDSLMAELYQNYLAEERLAVRQREEFFDWVASTSCLPKGLVLHFGDVLSFPNFSSKCGRCTVCTSGNAVPISYPPQASKFNEMAFQAVLSSIPAKDDARLMACFACGIVTPQMKSKKWSNKRKVFGMMRDHSYEEVLQRCQDVVKSRQQRWFRSKRTTRVIFSFSFLTCS